jgi:hypothetical protein
MASPLVAALCPFELVMHVAEGKARKEEAAAVLRDNTTAIER